MDELTIKLISSLIVSAMLFIAMCVCNGNIGKVYKILHLTDDLTDVKERKKVQRRIDFAIIMLAILIVCNIFSFKVLALLIVYILTTSLYIYFIKDEIKSMIKIYSLLKSEVFKKGDYVSVNEIEGKITKIDKKYITIETMKNQVVTLMNCDIKMVYNYSKNPIVSYVDVIIETKKYDANITNILQEGLIRLNEHYSEILEGPNVLGIEFLSDDITIRISVKTKYENKNTIERVIRKEVKRILDYDNKK